MLSDNEVTAFLDLCVRDKQKAAKRFRQLSNTDRPQGGKMGEVLLERIVEQGVRLSGKQVEKLIVVLGNSIDELAPRQPDTESEDGYPDFLRGEKHQIFGLIDRLEESQRKNTLETLFKHATSLAWLSGIIRSSTIQQGYFGHDAEPEVNWLLTADEFETIRTIFLKRLRDTEPDVLRETPYFLKLLYAWYQGGDPESVKAWMKNQSSTDHGFMDLLSKMGSWGNSSDTGVRYTIRFQTLETFFSGTQSVEHRLNGIAQNSGNTAEIRQQATSLLENIDRGRY